MNVIRLQRRVTPFVTAVVLLVPMPPALAEGQRDAHPAMTQGSRLPGIPVAGADTTTDRRRAPVEVTFTKWRTAGLPSSGVPIRHFFKGIVGGDLGAGDFVGEVLDRKVSTACTAFEPACTPGTTPDTITGSIIALQAIYEVQVGDHSFTALIQGGTNGVTGAALLEGVILAGWRTGAPVHIAFQTLTNCTGAPAGTCFRGTIRIERAPED